MKRNERRLLAVLVVNIGVFVVIPAIWGFLSGPVTSQKSKLNKAEENLRKETDSFDRSIARMLRMADFKKQSLSSNSSQGALAYQQWLTDLTEIVAGFSESEVGPERISLSRDKTYVAVRMRVTGEGTIEQLRRFLYRFHRANVLHRMVSLTVEAKNNATNPRVSVRVLTEALSLRDAPIKGATLFARTTVAELNEDSPGLITVASTNGFPEKAPFEVRIGGTYHNVVDVTADGWQMAVSEDQTLTIATDDQIEYSPIHPEYQDASEEQFDALITLNPFEKPAPYRPRLDLIGEKTVLHGATLELTPKVLGTGFDLSSGDPVFSVVSELPAGMTLEDGILKWTPGQELEPGEFPVKISAQAETLREPLEGEFTITLRKINNPPQLEIPDSLVATLGQAMSFTVSATDEETANEALRFALAEGAPAGAEINAETGEFTWTPSADLNPGEIRIPIQVSDDGMPAQTVKAQATIDVKDDRALFTYLTSSVAADGVRQAWLYDRSTDKRLILREGGQLDYAGYDALVLAIGDNFVLLQQEADTIRLKIGKNLREAEVIDTIEPAAAEKPPAAATTEASPAPDSENKEVGDGVEPPENGDSKLKPTEPSDTASESETSAESNETSGDTEPQT